MKVDVAYMFQLMIFITFLTTMCVYFYYGTYIKHRVKLRVFNKLEKCKSGFSIKLKVKDYTVYEKLHIWWYCSLF